MFTSQVTLPPTPFLRHITTGVATPFPAITFCQVEFDSGCYADTLFSQHGIPFPSRLEKAVVKRRAEYLAARCAAGYLLQQAGCDGHVGSSASRAPVWPAGWCGSLTHSHGHAMAVIAPVDAGLSPGIDIEMFDGKTMRETAEMFTSPQERQLLANCGVEYETALLITFSAKESLFKALYPQVGNFFGFDAARVCALDMTTGTITLTLTLSLTPERPQGSQLSGHFLIQQNRVITLIA
ncbi:4'-phosphopantetheinyl transferase superfamily protein [Enterobacter sp. Bisph1]|uniref:4'-phosphopantetheinyl transferase family protein n=1 Tax=Enterobacter sp. Bisph1 TaxID=1274399 RepID=UPI00057BE1C5|nr:4'-phosphopantetheinyl transferase superfamily protein [Enterobacter sp. Bisph1]